MQKILIVEDDAKNNQMLNDYLEEHGYACTQAFSGSEAKLLFGLEEYDLVLLDLMLPGISGEELVSVFSEKTERQSGADGSGGAGMGEHVPEQKVYAYREWTMNPDTQEMTASGRPVELTRHVFLIMELLIRNPKRVFTKQMIYEYAWGEEYLAEDKTINVHISNIRSKLKKSGTDSYIQTVWGMGFKLS